jgi:hypothetical protein
MHSVVPEARLIYLVRDPIERIVSHYLHRVANHPSIGSFEQALADPEHGPGLIAYCRYWQQLEQYLAYFWEERILVFDTHNLKEQRESTMAQVFGFLGVDPAHRSPELRHRHNQADESGRLTVPGRLVLRGLNAALGPRRASRARELTPPRMRGQFRLPYERPVPSAKVRARLEDELRPRLNGCVSTPVYPWRIGLCSAGLAGVAPRAQAPGSWRKAAGGDGRRERREQQSAKKLFARAGDMRGVVIDDRRSQVVAGAPATRVATQLRGEARAGEESLCNADRVGRLLR